MAKKGLDISTIHSVLKDIKTTGGWSLCIGAGTSLPVLPDWFSLVDKLIRNNCRAKDVIDIEAYKNLGFSADAMIQAVKNRLKVSDAKFVQMLSEEVYAPIKMSVNSKEWESFVKVHDSSYVAGIAHKDLQSFEQVIKKVFQNTTANILAQRVINAICYDLAPKSILTFNGEAVFLALLNYYWIIKNNKKQKFDRIINGISKRNPNRIPYIHCHGALPINGAEIKKGKNAIDKLVFSESSYLQLATTPISWQSINFIENCMQSKMVFIGVSLSDANMRRWLGWIHNNKMEEFKNNGIQGIDATEHFWINKKPKTTVEQLWIEESVAHLGIRLVWIDEWSQIGEVFDKMLGIS